MRHPEACGLHHHWEYLLEQPCSWQHARAEALTSLCRGGRGNPSVYRQGEVTQVLDRILEDLCARHEKFLPMSGSFNTWAEGWVLAPGSAVVNVWFCVEALACRGQLWARCPLLPMAEVHASRKCHASNLSQVLSWPKEAAVLERNDNFAIVFDFFKRKHDEVVDLDQYYMACKWVCLSKKWSLGIQMCCLYVIFYIGHFLYCH